MQRRFPFSFFPLLTFVVYSSFPPFCLLMWLFSTVPRMSPHTPLSLVVKKRFAARSSTRSKTSRPRAVLLASPWRSPKGTIYCFGFWLSINHTSMIFQGLFLFSLFPSTRSVLLILCLVLPTVCSLTHSLTLTMFSPPSLPHITT